MRIHSNEISSELSGETVTLAGWIHEIRDLGGVLFLIIRDREGLIQVTMPKKKVKPDLLEIVREVSKESVIQVDGEVKPEPRAPNGVEIIPSSIELLSRSDSPLPLDTTGKVDADLDTRLDSRFMDMRRPPTQAVFRLRSMMVSSIRLFLEEEGFVEISTPKIVATATEGGTALFPLTYFDREAFLNQSPQLYKQIMMAGGLERVYEIGPIFRAEEHDTRKHLNEATSIDIEASFVDHWDVMDILERLIVRVYEDLSEKGEKWLGIFDVSLNIPEAPFPRLNYEEAISIADQRTEETFDWGDDLSTAAEKAVGEEVGEHYFIVDWPTDIKPYYTQPYEERPEICKAFDLMHPMMELASGAQRVHDPALLTTRIENQGLDPDGFEFYLRAFRYGIPPHAGWGLGAERLLQTMLGLPNIREVVLFPRDRRRVTP